MRQIAGSEDRPVPFVLCSSVGTSRSWRCGLQPQGAIPLPASRASSSSQSASLPACDACGQCHLHSGWLATYPVEKDSALQKKRHEEGRPGGEIEVFTQFGIIDSGSWVRSVARHLRGAALAPSFRADGRSASPHARREWRTKRRGRVFLRQDRLTRAKVDPADGLDPSAAML